MLLTLNVNSIRDKLAPRGKKTPLAVVDVPAHASQELGLHGLTLHAGLLAGATRRVLEQIRDRGDKTGCACLVLTETEPLGLGEASDDAGDAAVARMLRVVQAASVLGCSSAALSIKARADDVAFERVVERMKLVSELAERIEVNVLIAPHPGLTADPDQCTALIKKIGGFRVGTMPDFQTAVATDDPAGYLRRLTPFASAVNATTVKFEDPPADGPSDDEKAGDDKPDEGSEKPLTGEEALLAELESMFDEPPPPVHVTFDLEPLVGAVTAVGYDQTLAIDYRGTGDSTLGVIQSREALEAALEAVAQ